MMKEPKKTVVKAKTSENKEEIKKNKKRLNDLFKSFKTGISSIMRPLEKNLQSTNKIPSAELLTNNYKDKTVGRNSRIEEYSTTQVLSGTRRKTSDNLPIYTMEELNIGKGGNTEDCPFDCQCCY